VFAGGSLWSVTEQGTVMQVDIGRRRVIGSTPLALPAGPGGMAVGMGAAWVTDSGSPNLYRLGSGVTAAQRIPLPPLGGGPARATGGVAVAARSVWVVRDAAQTVDRLSPDGRLEHRFRIAGAKQVVGDARGIWVTSSEIGVVTELDPRTNAVRARFHLRPVVCCLALGGGSAWATSLARGLLWQLRPDGAVADVVHVPAPATEVAYADGAVWISGYTAGTVTRVDADSLDARVQRIGQPVAGMTASPGLVAFSTFASERGALAGVRGPVARIVTPHNYAADTDPAVGAEFGDLDADLQRLDATCLSLYEHKDGRLVAYAASGPPVRTRGGRVWTFRVHPGFRFSPPSGERVDAGTFAATIERSTSPALRRSAAAKALADVEGMSAYRRGLTSHVAGVQARGATLTIRLQHPVADLDARLALPWFCAVPKDTPAIPTGLQAPIPSAGPYYVAAGSGSAWSVLRRNPYYPQPDLNGFSAFVYHFDVEQRQALDMLRRGRADYVALYGHDVLSR
jgi:streptogramin lyase